MWRLALAWWEASTLRLRSLTLALLLLASPAWAQDYQPEAQPLPSPELGLYSIGFLAALDTPAVADPGEPVTIDVLCARLVGAVNHCATAHARLQVTTNGSGQGHVTWRLA